MFTLKLQKKALCRQFLLRKPFKIVFDCVQNKNIKIVIKTIERKILYTRILDNIQHVKSNNKNQLREQPTVFQLIGIEEIQKKRSNLNASEVETVKTIQTLFFRSQNNLLEN